MYHTLLLLTDGAIHDHNKTKDQIVELSNYPVSIIIVGVGSADFTNMQELDADLKGLTNSQGESA